MHTWLISVFEYDVQRFESDEANLKRSWPTKTRKMDHIYTISTKENFINLTHWLDQCVLFLLSVRRDQVAVVKNISQGLIEYKFYLDWRREKKNMDESERDDEESILAELSLTYKTWKVTYFIYRSKDPIGQNYN